MSIIDLQMYVKAKLHTTLNSEAKQIIFRDRAVYKGLSQKTMPPKYIIDLDSLRLQIWLPGGHNGPHIIKQYPITITHAWESIFLLEGIDERPYQEKEEKLEHSLRPKLKSDNPISF